MTRSTGEKLIKQHQACVDAIADTLREVGHPVVCGGVDTGPNGGHTAETICDAIRSLAAKMSVKKDTDQCEECEREATIITEDGVGLCDVHCLKAPAKSSEEDLDRLCRFD